MLPKGLKELPEYQRLKLLESLQKALEVEAPQSKAPKNDEHNVWSRNDEELLADAEDELYQACWSPEWSNDMELYHALGLTDEKVELRKSFGEDYFGYEDVLLKAKDNGQHKISDMIELSKQKRKDFLKYLQDGNTWSKKKLAEIDRILRQKLPDYATIAEEFMTRAAFIAKIRDKAMAEGLELAGAFVDRFPKTIEAAKHEGVVLTLKEKQAAERAGKKVKILPLQPQEVRTVENATLRAADKITEISDRHRAGVRQLIIQAVNGRWSPQQLAQALFDKYGEENRDWRRVAITELAMATNDAFLAGCAEGDEVWVAPVEGSCKYCKQYLEGKKFIVTFDPKKMGNTFKQEMEYVWVGKTNYNRKVSEYIPCIPLHPNCRHRYHKLSRFYEVGADGRPKLRDVKDLIQEERKRRGLGEDPNLK
jgi:hypothetical protein